MDDELDKIELLIKSNSNYFIKCLNGKNVNLDAIKTLLIQYNSTLTTGIEFLIKYLKNKNWFLKHSITVFFLNFI